MNQSQTVKEYMTEWIKTTTNAESVTIDPLFNSKNTDYEGVLIVKTMSIFTSGTLAHINYYLSVCMTQIIDNMWIMNIEGDSIVFSAKIKTTMKDGFNTVR